MAHLGIIGMTQSGKTTLAKLMIRQARQRGVKSIVLDILCDPAFEADYQTKNQAEFLDMVWSSRKCLVVVDEGAEAVGHYNGAMNALATRGRHWGHSCIFITQRATGIAPLVRDQWSSIALFLSGRKNGELLSEEFACEELKNCVSLPMGEYYYISRGGKLSRGNAFEQFHKPLK